MLNETQIILNRLAVADREHQKEAGGRLLLRSVKYGCAAVLFGFVLDVIFHLGADWRLGILLMLLSPFRRVCPGRFRLASRFCAAKPGGAYCAVSGNA
jgi:hypothetical protein